MEGPPKPHPHVGSTIEVSMMSLVLALCLIKVERLRLTKSGGPWLPLVWPLSLLLHNFNLTRRKAEFSVLCTKHLRQWVLPYICKFKNPRAIVVPLLCLGHYSLALRLLNLCTLYVYTSDPLSTLYYVYTTLIIQDTNLFLL